MIFLHILQFSGIERTGLLYSMTHYLFFFMPWFFFKSGMFYRMQDSKSLIIKDSTKLLKPFVLFSLFGVLIDAIVRFISGDFSLRWLILSNAYSFIRFGSMHGNAALWFLIDLFLVKQAFHLAMRVKPNPPIAAILLILGCPIVAFFLNRYDWTIPVNVGGIVVGLFFYVLGYMLRKLQYSNIIFTLALLLYVMFTIVGLSRVSIFKNVLQDGNYWLFFLNALAGIIIINNFVFKLSVNFKFLNYIGRNSMVYYVSHWPFLVLCQFCLSHFDLPIWTDISIYIVGIVSYCLLMETINKNMNFI